jgi:hypothetical protein
MPCGKLSQAELPISWLAAPSRGYRPGWLMAALYLPPPLANCTSLAVGAPINKRHFTLAGWYTLYGARVEPKARVPC